MNNDTVFKSFIKRASDYGVTPAQAEQLCKRADMSKIFSGLRNLTGTTKATMTTPAAKNIINWGIPAAVGAGTAYGVHDQGAGMGTTIGSGLGAAMFSDPRRWKQNMSTFRESGLQAGGKEVMKDIIQKGGLTAGGAALDFVPGVLSNVANTSKNVSNASTELSKATTGVGDTANKDIHKMLGSYTGGAEDFGETMKNLSEAAKGINQTSTAMGKSAPSALEKLPGFMDATTQAVNSGGQAAQGINSTLSKLEGKIPKFGDPSNIDWEKIMRLGGKDWTRTGVAGGGVLGAYLLSKMMNSNEDKRPKAVYY